MDMIYQVEGKQRGFSSKKDFKRWYLKHLSARAADLLKHVPENVEAAKRSFLNNFSRYWRIISASVVHDSILMWSHYGDNHSGIVLEFDTNDPPFSQIGNDSILMVKYSERKPDYIHFDHGHRFNEMMFAVAATKAIDWAYEKEVRILVAASALRDALYLPLTPASIKGVILGCRAHSTTESAVRETLGHRQFRHVRILQAELHPSMYALNFREITQRT
jgi:hypothetical protein